MATVTITPTITVDEQLLVDLLVTAAEGGSNYWAHFTVVKGDDGANYTRLRVQEYEPHSDAPRVDRIVDARELAGGLEKLLSAKFATAGKHFTDAIAQRGDAITADVVLQMTLFGDVIYG